jgi:hypothetical protein
MLESSKSVAGVASVRLVSLAQDGAVVLWKSNDVTEARGEESIPVIDSLRPSSRLEGLVNAKGDSPPEMIYHRFADTLSVLDGNRVGAWRKGRLALHPTLPPCRMGKAYPLHPPLPPGSSLTSVDPWDVACVAGF